jgi:hypothetical protein
VDRLTPQPVGTLGSCILVVCLVVAFAALFVLHFAKLAINVYLVAASLTYGFGGSLEDLMKKVRAASSFEAWRSRGGRRRTVCRQIRINVIAPDLFSIDLEWLTSLWIQFTRLFTSINIGIDVQNGVSCTGAQVLRHEISPPLRLAFSAGMCTRPRCTCASTT